MRVKTNIIKTSKRLQWYGHDQRMNSSSIPQLVMNWKHEGKNKRGRPRKRWKNKLMRDMEENGIDEKDTRNRKRWKQKLKDVFG